MKKLLKYFIPLCSGIVLISCYGLEKEEYRELAPITVSGVEQTIYAKATEKLTLNNLRVESGNDHEIEYEWAYGRPQGDFPNMIDSMFISSSPTLDYAFNKAGRYVLRLRIDNGESIGFYYYDLRVQAGFDEGYLLLCDDEGAGTMTFVKVRSPQEEADNEQEIWDDVLSINSEYDFRNLRDVYIFSTPGYTSGILISTGDDKGSIYRLDPVTLEVTYHMKSMDEYGILTNRIVGEKTSGTSHYAYLVGEDGSLYRYEFPANMLIRRETPYPIEFTYQGYGYYPGTGVNYGVREPVFFTADGYVRCSSAKIIGAAAPEGYEFINFAGTRLGSEMYYAVTRSLKGSPREIKILSTRGSNPSLSPVSGGTYLETSPMLLDRNSKMVNTKLNTHAYYNYDNKIYHWAMGGTTPEVPAEGDQPDITLPDGEQIMDICTNAVPSTSSTVIDDDKLLIATYNPTVTDRKPGSLYLYDLRTMKKEKEWIGICEKPVAVAYKFPTSN